MYEDPKKILEEIEDYGCGSLEEAELKEAVLKLIEKDIPRRKIIRYGTIGNITRVCPYCDFSNVQDGAKYCQECGNRFRVGWENE